MTSHCIHQTLEKISSEYPHAVVKEGGLAAVLMFLDFFPTNVQRTAVKTAANCCRGIQHDSISMIQDILPNLENLLRASDQKMVEQACLCFVRLADSYKSKPSNLQVGGFLPFTISCYWRCIMDDVSPLVLIF